MKVGVISDLHSNAHALDAVLTALDDEPIDHLLVLGDLFGYHPWALRTWERLRAVPWPMTLIKGNHDEMILRRMADPDWTVEAFYADSIAHNLEELRSTPALETLRKLPFERAIDFGDHRLRLTHGTPEDPENGRFYPDNTSIPDWLPKAGEWLFLGHTHYPMFRQTADGGWLVNPGSVGQPRDSNPDAAFAIADIALGKCALRRAAYDIAAAQAELRQMGWDDRIIRALDKRRASK